MSINESKKIVSLSFLIGIIFIVFISNFCSTFSLESNQYKFESENYNINNEYIENVSPYTSVSLYKKYFDIENCHIEVFYDDLKVDNNSYITNGSKTIIYDENENIIKTYINVIKGDINNDGIVNNLDLEEFGKYLVENYEIEEYQLKSLDINSDNEIHTNDLLLLDKTLTNGYENITLDKENITIRLNEETRIHSNITPNYGLNQNLVWTSSQNDIVTVDETGKIFGNNGGEAIITATTYNGEEIDQVKVVVDNSIILDSYEGEAYVDGYQNKVNIDVLKYDTITCKSANDVIATCEIIDKQLVITGHQSGATTLTISGDKYKDAIYKVKSGIPRIGSYNKAGCNMLFTQVVGFFAGELENYILEPTEPEIVVGSYVGKANTGAKVLVLEYGPKYGRTIVKIKGSTSPKVLGEILIDHSVMYLEDRYKFAKPGETISTTISGENLGTISCKIEKPQEQEIADCRIEDNQLIVTAKAIGQADITVSNTFTYEGNWNGNCGNRIFTIFVEE